MVDPTVSEEIHPLAISLTYWVLPCLQELTKVDEVETFFRKHTERPVDRLLRGYALALVIILGNFVDLLLPGNPFGVEDDFVLSRSFQGNVPFERMPSGSPLGMLVRKIVSLYRPLRAAKTLNDMSLHIQRIRDSFLTPMQAAFEESVGLDPEINRQLSIDKEQCLKRLGIENIHIFLCEVHKVENIFRATYRHNKGSLLSRIPSDFYLGYKLSLAFLLDRLSERHLSRKSITSLIRTRSWRGLDKKYRRIQRELVDPIERNLNVDYNRAFFPIAPISETTRDSLIRCNFALPDPTLTKEEEVRRAFLWYSTREVGPEGITWPSVMGITVLIEGVFQYQKDETIRVVRFDHPAPYATDFSFAVLVPSLSNYSEWWVFPDFCYDKGGTGASGFRELSTYLNQMKSRLGRQLSFETLQIEKDLFLKLVRQESETENRPTRYSQKLEQDLDEARGWMLELVAVSILSNQGYACAHRVRKSTLPALGNYELDIVATKLSNDHAEILLVECSAAYDSKEDVNGLRSKIRVVERNRADLMTGLGLPKAKRASVKGWLLTAQQLPAKRRRLKSVKVIDSVELSRLAEASKVPWKQISKLFPQSAPRERVRHIDIERLFSITRREPD